jgi:hypothetical protein
LVFNGIRGVFAPDADITDIFNVARLRFADLAYLFMRLPDTHLLQRGISRRASVGISANRNSYIDSLAYGGAEAFEGWKIFGNMAGPRDRFNALLRYYGDNTKGSPEFGL